MFKLNNVKMVIFDMAGTTINEGGLVYKTIKETLNYYNIFYTDKEFNTFHGVNKKQVIRHFIEKNDSDVNLDLAYSRFQNDLINNYTNNKNIKLMDGALDLFKKLRNDDIKVCLNTGYSREMAETILNNVNIEIGKDIDALVASDEVPLGRPAPYMINTLMKKYDIGPNHVAKVGDTVIDIKEGKNANVKYKIAVLSGADDFETLSKEDPNFIVNSVKDLI